MAATICISGYVYQGPQQEIHHGEFRSPHWPKVRAEHLKLHPECAACGNSNKKELQVHHIIGFHFDPSKELDPTNLITLCISGPAHLNCHMLIGHSGRFSCNNPDVVEDSKVLRSILLKRVCN